MTSRVTESFFQLYCQLPHEVRAIARKNYQIWKINPDHPGLQFKKIHGPENIYSVRIGQGWRVIGYLEEDRMTWFWIGSHAEYDRLLKNL